MKSTVTPIYLRICLLDQTLMVNKTSQISLSFFLPISGGSRMTC